MKETALRTATAAGIVALVSAILYWATPPVFAGVIYLVASGAALELSRLLRPRRLHPLLILGGGLGVMLSLIVPWISLSMVLPVLMVVSGSWWLLSIRSQEDVAHFAADWGKLLLTWTYVYLPLSFLVLLFRLQPLWLVMLFATVAVGDSGAYFLGKRYGRTKIYPVASPKKSLQGLLAGITTGALAGCGVALLFPALNLSALLGAVFGFALAGVSQLADPVESLFKRAAGVKDSGSLLPGHGGVLDRVDSYLFCAPLLYLVLYFLSATPV